MTDDIRDPAATDEEPSEATPDGTTEEDAQAAPEAEEQVDWKRKYEEANKALSKQGRELGILRQEAARVPGVQPAAPSPDAPDLEPAIAQELAFYRSQFANVAQQQVTAQLGSDVAEAVSFMDRAIRLDPSPVGRANAFVAAVQMLAETVDEAAPEAPAPKPKAPARMESNRSDDAPPADLAHLAREAEAKKDPDSLRALVGARLRAAGLNR